jgi:hypothetical protein
VVYLWNFLVSVLYHNLDMVEERDAYVTRHLETEEAMKEAAVVVAEYWINQVWNSYLTSGQHLPSGSQTLTGLMRCTKHPKIL